MMRASLCFGIALTESRLRQGLTLPFAACAGLVLLAWCSRIARSPRPQPLLFGTGALPLVLLAVLWPLVRGPLCAILAVLLLVSVGSPRARRALRLLLLLFTGFLPFFVLINVDDPFWAVGFLIVYLGIVTLAPTLVDAGEGAEQGSARFRQFLYGVSVGFLWILVFSALLWYLPDLDAGG